MAHKTSAAARFLSTPSARRATCAIRDAHRTALISIHALREEGDDSAVHRIALPAEFLSTPSARRATASTGNPLELLGISIHALREEGDSVPAEIVVTASDFYPRPPRGGRRGRPKYASASANFYPRPPRGGRHIYINVFSINPGFLSTPSARRATRSVFVLDDEPGHFYPRPPRGGRRVRIPSRCQPDNFYPRPPRGGRRSRSGCAGVTWGFLSTPSARRATKPR